MEIRSQLEVRGLFLKYLSQISRRDKQYAIKLLEQLVNEHRNNKSSKLSISLETSNKQNVNESLQTRKLRHSFEEFFRQLEPREYNKLISVIEFEIMKPSNLFGYLKEINSPNKENSHLSAVAKEGLINDDSCDSDIQIIEIVTPSPVKTNSQLVKPQLNKVNSFVNNLTINNSSNNHKSLINESINETNNVKNGTIVDKLDTKLAEPCKQPEAATAAVTVTTTIIGKKSKKSLNRIVLLEQIAAKQTKASKLKLNKGMFKQIQYKDYVDYATNKLLDSKLKALDFKSNTITLTANILGVHKSESNDQELYLVEWIPDNYAPNEWVLKEDFKSEKIVDMTRLKANNEQIYLDGLYKQFRHRTNRRK